jgi:FAD synthetase
MDNLLSSYNGGKDADVIMHLLRAVAAKLEHDSGIKNSPKHVYFAVEDEFPEVIEHLEFSQRAYDLDVVRYDCGIVQVR